MVNTYNHYRDFLKRGNTTEFLTRIASVGALLFWVSEASEPPMPKDPATETRADGSGPGLEKPRSNPGTANHRRLASRLQMESRFRVLDLRFDSLWADSLLVPMPKRQQYLKSLQTASWIRDSAKARLLDLRIFEAESNSGKWESIRKKTERSLDGLHRFFLDAESIIPVDPESNNPIAPVQDGDVFECGSTRCGFVR